MESILKVFGLYDRYELFVYGYIRRIQNSLLDKLLFVPSDIYHMIYSWFIARVIKIVFCDEITGKIDESKYIQRGIYNMDYMIKDLYYQVFIQIIFIHYK